MAKRKTSQALKKGGAHAKKVAARQDRERADLIFGEPLRPEGLPEVQRRRWNEIVQDCHAARLLAKSDGPFLLETIQLRMKAHRAKAVKRYFKDRTPFPKEAEPVVVREAMSLDQFLAEIAKERKTFKERIVPDQSLTLDENGKPYEWREGDPTTVARTYCQEIIAGTIIAGSLTVRMAKRALDDWEHAHERGFAWDVVAARLICQWFCLFCGIKLEPWEQFILCSAFAWKNGAGYRRFKEVWVSIARKNGKTALSAGVGLFGLIADVIGADGTREKFQEIYSSATKKDQAHLTYRDSVRMVDAHPDLKAFVKKSAKSLTVADDDGTYSPLSSDVRSSDGTRPGIVLADEIHEWADRTQFDKLVSGQVFKPNRMVWCTTTAGNNLESFAAGKEAFLENVVNGLVEDDERLVCIWRYEREWDYADESKWLASNPNLGVSVLSEGLRSQLTEIKNDGSALNGFLRFACNLWVTHRAGATFSIETIDKLRGGEFKGMDPLKIREWAIRTYVGERCLAGLDFGEVSDMCCLTLLFDGGKMPDAKKPMLVATGPGTSD